MEIPKLNRRGATRFVILTKRWAIKIPYVTKGWKRFLWGLLSNIQEADFNTLHSPHLCPVLWHIPGGWLVLMPRVQILTPEEYELVDYMAFVNRPELLLPIEDKPDSFGWHHGQLVGVDYGS